MVRIYGLHCTLTELLVYVDLDQTVSCISLFGKGMSVISLGLSSCMLMPKEQMHKIYCYTVGFIIIIKNWADSNSN